MANVVSVFGIFIAFLILNLIFWIFFIFVFKNRYSPEKVLGKIKDEVDQIELSLVQRSTEITDDIVRQKHELRTLMRQLDERLKVARQETERKNEAAQLAENLRNQEPLLQQNKLQQNKKEEIDDFALADKMRMNAENARIAQNQANSEPSETERIVRLYGNGFESDEIAEKLGLSSQQVAIVLNAEKMKRGK